MGNGFPRLLRTLAVLGMGMATFEFVIQFADWVAPHEYLARPTGGSWFGKRASIALNSQTTRPVGHLVQYSRAEAGTFLATVRDPSIWFCLASIVYLLADHRLAAQRRDATDPGE